MYPTQSHGGRPLSHDSASNMHPGHSHHNGRTRPDSSGRLDGSLGSEKFEETPYTRGPSAENGNMRRSFVGYGHSTANLEMQGMHGIYPRNTWFERGVGRPYPLITMSELSPVYLNISHVLHNASLTFSTSLLFFRKVLLTRSARYFTSHPHIEICRPHRISPSLADCIVQCTAITALRSPSRRLSPIYFLPPTTYLLSPRQADRAQNVGIVYIEEEKFSDLSLLDLELMWWPSFIQWIESLRVVGRRREISALVLAKSVDLISSLPKIGIERRMDFTVKFSRDPFSPSHSRFHFNVDVDYNLRDETVMRSAASQYLSYDGRRFEGELSSEVTLFVEYDSVKRLRQGWFVRCSFFFVVVKFTQPAFFLTRHNSGQRLNEAWVETDCARTYRSSALAGYIVYNFLARRNLDIIQHFAYQNRVRSRSTTSCGQPSVLFRILGLGSKLRVPQIGCGAKLGCVALSAQRVNYTNTDVPPGMIDQVPSHCRSSEVTSLREDSYPRVYPVISADDGPYSG
ncbi:uncharacterized protein MYCFIDRAFT_172642 [Pseudocercospora fijiensis CIRAD86]|uniref:Uncharacterized protein n=1 Tax=Pseudocercospora fijiensis (strain CIRAD86) TaxID=383855 RepID=M3BCG2_PSEFD|nr:uncharacterized protein MYCFIDRAFT_172642 [Pseudocercospora fijiensis CIRAD86]EME86967.1 hypothetical protein MYCFIDRAFT_172642 [Pseudocercospora fijiensis CIRAD86]